MIGQNLNQLLSESVSTVLETMFFSEAAVIAEPQTTAAVIKTRLAFHGRPSGILTVSLSSEAARVLAAGFLGEDEEMLEDSQPGEVVCELANMLCGSLLSQLGSEETFDLTSPELMPAGTGVADDSELFPAASQSFAVENGILTASLHLEPAP